MVLARARSLEQFSASALVPPRWRRRQSKRLVPWAGGVGANRARAKRGVRMFGLGHNYGEAASRLCRGGVVALGTSPLTLTAGRSRSVSKKTSN